MTISQDVAQMYCVAKGAGVARHENAAIPEEGKWIHAKEIKDISVFVTSNACAFRNAEHLSNILRYCHN